MNLNESIKIMTNEIISYFRLFEGGMLSADAFLQGKNERTVCWGTSGQSITDGYKIDSFGMVELLDSGILLYGEDIRGEDKIKEYSQNASICIYTIGWN